MTDDPRCHICGDDPMPHLGPCPECGRTSPATRSVEQRARDLLGRMGVDDSQSFSSGDVVELASLLAEVDRLRGKVELNGMRDGMVMTLNGRVDYAIEQIVEWRKRAEAAEAKVERRDQRIAELKAQADEGERPIAGAQHERCPQCGKTDCGVTYPDGSWLPPDDYDHTDTDHRGGGNGE